MEAREAHGALVLTAQERPEGMSRGFREDLFKKMASADAIFGRLPHQMLTKAIHLVGWKRMELNRLVRFLGVRESCFNSVYRRCLLIKMQARFFDKKFLAEHVKDAGKYGFLSGNITAKGF